MAQKLEIKGNTFYITDTVTGKEWKLPAKDVRTEDNKDNSVTFYDTAKIKSNINIAFSDLIDSTDTAFTDFQALTDWNDANLGKSSAEDTAVTTIYKSLGQLWVSNQSSWFGIFKTGGSNYYSHAYDYGINADTLGDYTNSSIINVFNSIRLKRIVLSAYTQSFVSGSFYDFKIIKYNRSTLLSFETILSSTKIVDTGYQVYIDNNISFELTTGDVVVLIWKCNENNQYLKDTQIIIDYEKIN